VDGFDPDLVILKEACVRGAIGRDELAQEAG
jgi:hypothetical protein